MDRDTLDYFRGRQCSTQWRDFLTSLASQLPKFLPKNDLHHLMHQSGTTFAVGYRLPESDTLEKLQTAMSEVWRELDWGYVVFEEQQDAIKVTHYFAPLRAAFGPDADSWAPSFLAGVYQEWFKQLGASDSLRVKQVGQISEFGTVEFSLAQH